MTQFDVNDSEAVLAEVARLQKELEELRNGGAVPGPRQEKKEDGVKKNHKPGKPHAGRKYVLLSSTLDSWGKVPQQQADLAKVLATGMEVGKEYTEQEVFDIVVEGACSFPSIAGSVQDPTYLFRYYRGLKKDAKHGGFVARDFIRVIG